MSLLNLNKPSKYPLIVKACHNLRLLLFALLYTIMVIRALLPKSNFKSLLFATHMQIATLIFILLIISLITMLFKANPPSIALNSLEKTIEKTTHALIYITILCIILLGFSRYTINISLLLSNNPNFVYNGFKVIGITVFNPDVIKNIGAFLIIISDKLELAPEVLADYFGNTHKILAIFVLPLLIFMHVAAILFHQFIVKSNPIKRMFR